MSTSRKYWVVSPNVRFDAKTVAAWRQASVKWQAAFMGWHPDDEAHRLGPKFARGIEPGDVILIARRANGKPETVGFGTYAKEQPVNSVVTAALGITTGDTVLRARSLTYTVGPLLHGYVPLPNGGLLIVLHNDNAKVIWFYRLEANLKLVAAISRETSQLPVVIPPAEAERNVAVELKFWSAVADQH
jgi:hypothetical protein